MTVHAPSPPSISTVSQISKTVEQDHSDLWVAVIFALKTLAAALLALFFAFWLGLDEPRWALLTVFVVSQPDSGLVIAKSFYRAVGTAAGLFVATSLVFTLAQYGDLFLAFLAVWMGVCNFAARAVRNFTSYGLLLAGYTAAIVGIPAALNPSAAYPLIVGRGTEIVLGIGCSALLSRLVAPQELAQKLVILVRKVINRVRHLGVVAIDPTADKASFATKRMELIEDLASVEAMRASAYFESAEARRLNEAVRQVTIVALTVCAIVENTAHRSRPAFHRVDASPWITPALISKTEDSPVENAAIITTLMSVSDQRAIFEADILLGRAASALDSGAKRSTPGAQLQIWLDPLPAVLTGLRSALAIAITSAIWIATAWPSGPTAIIVVASVCSLIAAMERPATISVALAATILVAGVPVFVTLFYLLPLASDFVSMALALAPLMLLCAFIMAQPRIGPMGQLSAVYFSVGSGIDNVMPYDTSAFLNTSFAILSGIGIALVLFATVFPENPPQALWRLRRQLLFQLNRLAKVNDYAFASYAYGLCDQLATTFARLKKESSEARRCNEMAMVALSAGYVLDRLKKTLDTDRLGNRNRHEITTLLSRIADTFVHPSRTDFTKMAWEARALRGRLLRQARLSPDIGEAEALSHALVGCEMLRSDLLKLRLLLPEVSSVWRG